MPTCSCRSSRRWIKPSANGSSVFALRRRASHQRPGAGWPTRKTRPTGGVNLGSHDRQVAKVLLDLSTTAQINDFRLKVGNAFLDEIKKINWPHKNSVEQAGFAARRRRTFRRSWWFRLSSATRRKSCSRRRRTRRRPSRPDDRHPALLHRFSTTHAGAAGQRQLEASPNTQGHACAWPFLCGGPTAGHEPRVTQSDIPASTRLVSGFSDESPQISAGGPVD